MFSSLYLAAGFLLISVCPSSFLPLALISSAVTGSKSLTGHFFFFFFHRLYFLVFVNSTVLLPTFCSLLICFPTEPCTLLSSSSSLSLCSPPRASFLLLKPFLSLLSSLPLNTPLTAFILYLSSLLFSPHSHSSLHQLSMFFRIQLFFF